MAIFHLNTKIVSRGKGQSAVAKAAYNSHDLLMNQNTDERHDYRYKGEVVFSGIFAPKLGPEWVDEIAKDREALWSAVEKAETRKNAQLAREIEIALPHELTDKQREWLVKDFVRENFVRHGMIADVAIHAPSPEGDQRNHHAHILATMRHIGPEGFVEKIQQRTPNETIREWREREKAQLQELRQKWENICNRYLERFGHEARVDNRTLEAQGIDREPTTHVGPTATDYERQGTKTDRGNINREIEERNRQRERLKEQGRQVTLSLKEARAAYKANAAKGIREAWKTSHDGLDFMIALNERGMCLARDNNNRYAAVAPNGLVLRLDAKTHGPLAKEMRAAIEAVRRDCSALIIPTVEERREELRQQLRQRRDAHLGATLYDRADMVSMQRDAMRHLKDVQRKREQAAGPKARRPEPGQPVPDPVSADQQQKAAKQQKRDPEEEAKRKLDEFRDASWQQLRELRKDERTAARLDKKDRTEQTDAKQRASGNQPPEVMSERSRARDDDGGRERERE